MTLDTRVESAPTPDILLDLLKKMVFIRRFEEKIVEVYKDQDMKSPVHLCIGQEAIAAGVCANLSKEDYLFTTHRGHGHYLAKGADPAALLAECYGRVDGCCGGKGGSMHPVAPEFGILGTSAIVGGGIPHAVGTALASAMRGDDRVSVVFFGDGASDEGTFYESMNFAALKKLPVVFICENNFYATNSHLSARQPHQDIFKRGHGLGIEGHCYDGNDVLEVYNSAKQAIDKARNGMGPSLIEYKTYRWMGHVGPEYDYLKGCRPQEELEEWMNKCPVNSFKEYLLKEGFLSATEFFEITSSIDKDLESYLDFAKKSSLPGISALEKGVYFGEDK